MRYETWVLGAAAAFIVSALGMAVGSFAAGVAIGMMRRHDDLHEHYMAEINRYRDQLGITDY